MSDVDPRDYFFGRRTDKAIFSSRFVNGAGQRMRIASHVLAGKQGLRSALVKDEVILRTTPAQRFQIKATLLEDDRRINVLTIQRFTPSRPTEVAFSFVGDEIDTLLEFVAGVRTVPLEHEGKHHISDHALKDIVLNEAQARKLFAQNEALFSEIAQSEELKRDLIAVGYRRKQLQRFENLLNDSEFFAAEKARLNTTPEGVWQKFFEENAWIFGYGLSFQFMSGLDKKKLEQVVRGADITGTGKRTDALMKTRGLVSSLCFVEVKRHDKPLLAANQTRPGVWAPSTYLSEGIAQVQCTVQDALEQIGRKLNPHDDSGNPTGETLYNIRPRSYVVAGHSSEFDADFGMNEAKVRSFELYRRDKIGGPEIITFDELFQRACFIVSDGTVPLAPNNADGDQIPF